eukprot:164517_1
MMKHVIISAFALYQLSIGQQIPQVNNPNIPVEPVLPLPTASTVHPESIPFVPVWSTHGPIVPVLPSTTTTIQPIASTASSTTSTAQVTTTSAAPIAPVGFQFGAFDQLCPITPQARCATSTDKMTDGSTGRVSCSEPSSCCMCSAIECGFEGTPCRQLQVGVSAAFGVQDIKISGAEVGAGAVIDCQGVDSCRDTKMNGRNVLEIDCAAPGSCQDAWITVHDPKSNFAIDCSGSSSCAGLKLDIYFTAPTTDCIAKNALMISGIECNGELSCAGMELSIYNSGCDHVVIDNVECVSHNSCNGAVFNLVGDIDIRNCQCGPSCSNARGLDKCYSNLEFVLCPDALSCMGITKTITNPAHDFEMICSNVQSCENSNFVLEIVPTLTNMSPATAWKGFTLSGMNAARGATFTIDNQLSAILEVDTIECRGAQSCAQTTFITGTNVIIEDVICAQGACYGCTIKSNVADPGIPCDARQVISPELVLPVQVLPINPGPIVEPQTPSGPWVPV